MKTPLLRCGIVVLAAYAARGNADSEKIFASHDDVYTKRCAMCHAEDGSGRGPIAKSLRPPPKDFSDAAWAQERTDEDLARVILLGGRSCGLSHAMPPHADLKADPTTLYCLIARVRAYSKTKPKLFDVEETGLPPGYRLVRHPVVDSTEEPNKIAMDKTTEVKLLFNDAVVRAAVCTNLDVRGTAGTIRIQSKNQDTAVCTGDGLAHLLGTIVVTRVMQPRATTPPGEAASGKMSQTTTTLPHTRRP